MLTHLAIRDVVLIERLDLALAPGLSVLTGETGAGKSILLDALGLALGARAEAGLIRAGGTQASVTAAFALPAHHPAHALLAAQEMSPAEDGQLVLRRTLGADGRSRAFVNDEPVSLALLKRLGALLVEVHGQFETLSLLDPATHLDLLDTHGALLDRRVAVGRLYQAWQADKAEAARIAAGAAAAEERAATLDALLAEATALAPKPGEAKLLEDSRQLLSHRERILEALNTAHQELGGSRGAETAVGTARRVLARVADRAAGALDTLFEPLDRASAALAETRELIQTRAADIDVDPGALELIEERLEALRALARRHGVEPDALPALIETWQAERTGLADLSGQAAAAQATAEASGAAYRSEAEALHGARQSAAMALARAVMAELQPLKLERARFVVDVHAAAAGPTGSSAASFLVATNPGTPPGPLGKIASGGELARFTLALKVVLAAASPLGTLVFDEVDAGVGGAVAAAVGERLARLGQTMQVLVVTHSPQVAGRGRTHWKVAKRTGAGGVRTEVEVLEPAQRREEVARMLAGETVTDAARAAADQLLAG